MKKIMTVAVLLGACGTVSVETLPVVDGTYRFSGALLSSSCPSDGATEDGTLTFSAGELLDVDQIGCIVTQDWAGSSVVIEKSCGRKTSTLVLDFSGGSFSGTSTTEAPFCSHSYEITGVKE